jgi:hypothetical protein
MEVDQTQAEPDRHVIGAALAVLDPFRTPTKATKRRCSQCRIYRITALCRRSRVRSVHRRTWLTASIILTLLPLGAELDARAAGSDKVQIRAAYAEAVKSGYQLALLCEAVRKYSNSDPAPNRVFSDKCKRFDSEIDEIATKLAERGGHLNFETVGRLLGWRYREWVSAASEAQKIEAKWEPPYTEAVGQALQGNQELKKSVENLIKFSRDVADSRYYLMQITRVSTGFYFPIPLEQLCSVTSDRDCEAQRALVLHWRARMKDCVLAPCSNYEISRSLPQNGYDGIRFFENVELYGDFGAAMIPKGVLMVDVHLSKVSGRRYCGLILVNDTGVSKFDADNSRLHEACINYDGQALNLSNAHRQISPSIIRSE